MLMSLWFVIIPVSEDQVGLWTVQCSVVLAVVWQHNSSAQPPCVNPGPPPHPPSIHDLVQSGLWSVDSHCGILFSWLIRREWGSRWLLQVCGVICLAWCSLWLVWRDTGAAPCCWLQPEREVLASDQSPVPNSAQYCNILQQSRSSWTRTSRVCSHGRFSAACLQCFGWCQPG